jgi:hypothetical protein
MLRTHAALAMHTQLAYTLLHTRDSHNNTRGELQRLCIAHWLGNCCIASRMVAATGAANRSRHKARHVMPSQGILSCLTNRCVHGCVPRVGDTINK